MGNKRGGQTPQRKKSAPHPAVSQEAQSHGQAQAQAQGQARVVQPSPTANRTGSVSPKPAASQEAKREARMQRQASEAAASGRRRRTQAIRRFGILAAVIVLVIGGATAYFLNEAGKPGEGVAQEPSLHISDENSPHASYSTDPPTSGPHVNKTLPWGVSTTPLVKEKAVHNLEDGGVIISYRPDMDKATVDQLAEIARSYDTDVLMAPYPGLSNPVVLTAWGRIDRLNSLDEARIKRFVDAYRGKDHHAQSGS